MGVAGEPHDGTQTAARHDERAEEADAMVTRSVARDEDQRADHDPCDGTDAPVPSLRRRHQPLSPGRNIVTTISRHFHAEVIATSHDRPRRRSSS